MYEKRLAKALAGVAQRRGARGFTFDDLVRGVRAEQARLSDIAEWLARGRSSGAFEELGFDGGFGGQPVGPRRYRVVDGASSAGPGEHRRAQAG